MTTDKKAEAFFKRIKQCRANLKNPTTREDRIKAIEEAADIMHSDEMGIFLALSPIYKALE
jgi:hypothetical protein